jgi:hypothetical protein
MINEITVKINTFLIENDLAARKPVMPRVWPLFQTGRKKPGTRFRLPCPHLLYRQLLARYVHW